MPRRHESPRVVRVVGGLLAMVWLCAGLVAIIAGLVAQRWLLLVVGLVALWYGVIWAHAAAQGRRLTPREALTPWRLRRR